MSDRNKLIFFIVPLSLIVYFFHNNILYFFNVYLGLSINLESILLVYAIILIVTINSFNKKT